MRSPLNRSKIERERERGERRRASSSGVIPGLDTEQEEEDEEAKEKDEVPPDRRDLCVC